MSSSKDNFVTGLAKISGHNEPENFLTGFPLTRESCLLQLSLLWTLFASSCMASNFSSSLSLALSLFWNWERSSLHLTEVPVGMCVALTAVSTLLMFCPPFPLERHEE